MGPVFPDDMFQAKLAAQSVSVRTAVAVDDDGVVTLNGFQQTLEHGEVPSLCWRMSIACPDRMGYNENEVSEHYILL
jgi:hypothetical protein